MANSLFDKLLINKEGYLTVGLCFVVTVIFFLFSSLLGVIGLFCTILVCYFFRDPKRMVPLQKDIVLSPADGTICKIETEIPPATMGIEEEMLKVSIF